MQIRAIRRGEHDASDTGLVKTFQRALITKGFSMPKFGADGYVGDETFRAAASFALANSTIPLEEIDDMETVIPVALVTKVFTDPERLVQDISINVHGKAVDALSRSVGPLFPLVFNAQDLPDQKLYSRNPTNPIANIDTICLHQMACEDGNNALESFKRWRNLAVQCVVTAGEQSRAAIFQPLTRRMAHGHGWNNRSVGIEIEGHYAGTLKADGTPNMNDYWRPEGSDRKPMRLHPNMVHAAQQLIGYICLTIDGLGGEIKFISAHRQSYSTKSSDPGEEIWKQIALPMIAKLGLKEAPTLTSGSPIPVNWNPANKGVKYE